MYLRLFIAAAIFACIIGQDFNQLHYTRDEETLIDCIENSRFLKSIKNSGANGIVKKISEFAAPRLTGNINARAIMMGIVMSLQNELLQSLPSTSTNEISWDYLQTSIINALVYCSDDYFYKRCSDSNHTAHRRDLPKFYGEIPYFTPVLNHMLVGWQQSLRVMASTPNGFAVLRNYFQDAQSALECALRYCENGFNVFRAMIRALFANRARGHFDLLKLQCYYMFYHYNATDGSIYTCGCAKKDAQFIEVPFVHNPDVLSHDLIEILSIHRAIRTGHDESDVFSAYKQHGMKSSQYYFERQIDQFYQILFFFRELIVNGLLHDEVVIDQDFIDRIPREILAILENGDYYGRYLLNLRERLLDNIADTRNSARQNLEETLRPHEEDMFVLMNQYPNISGVSILRSTTTTTTTTTSTTTARTISTTSEKPQLKRKTESVCKNYKSAENKKFKSFPDSCCEKNIEKSGTIDKDSIDSCLKQQFNYHVKDLNDEAFAVCSLIHAQQLKKRRNNRDCYGYVTYDDLHQSLEGEIEFFTKSLNILQNSDYCSLQSMS